MSSQDEELCYASAVELARGYRARRISPVEVIGAFLRRIERDDAAVGAHITVCAASALAGARRAEQRFINGTPIGPLDGIPFGLKDLFDTAGIVTTGGSRHFADRVPRRDSKVAADLAGAGAVLLGKHSLFEFASGMPELDVPYPAARNPWDLERVPGGSSSGSAAALAAGLCTLAFGSDTGGSIRGPASFCGIVGMKPSAGLIGRSGALTLSWTLDTVGPMSRSVADVATMLDSTAGTDPGDPGSVRGGVPTGHAAALDRGVSGLRIGAPIAVVQRSPDLDPETAAAYRAALSDLEGLGARVEEIDLPEFEHANVVVQSVITSEALAYHHERAVSQPDKFGDVFFRRLLQGALLTGEEYVTAQRGRALIERSMRQVMADCDLIVMPTMPRHAGTPAEESAVSIWDRSNYMRIFNISGQPAVSLPCGMTTHGMPIGLQIAGRVFEDATVLAAAAAYESIHHWDRKRPPRTGGLS